MLGVGVLVKPVSGLCNMRCGYCFYRDEAEKRQTASYGRMSGDTLKNVIRRTLTHAEREYSLAFQGGEPTLAGLDFYRYALRLISQYNRHGAAVRLALQTNGCDIDEEWAAFFAENGFLIGLSADGTGEIHDRYRKTADGGSSWQRVLLAAELFDRSGVEYNILPVVHREVAENIGEI